ncbi:MAG: ABC transporter substrate-binding protein, partial [Planctomycetes bacterium]|nr:ABC transporter substrate-binding protein [Planctomycetota bacterium]
MKLWTGLLVLLLAVAGCSYQGEDSPVAAPSDDPAKTTPAGPYSPDKDPLVNPDSLFEKAPAEADKIARDETLVRYLKSDPGTLNPLFTSSVYETYVEDTLFDGLFTFNSDFEWIINESMVESWEKTEDHKTWTVKLRAGLKWHDGHPLTAHDVAFTWEAIMDDAVPTKTLRSGRDQLESVTALDDLTVRFVHKEALPTGKWNMLYSILPKHIIGDKNDENRKKDPSLKKDPYYLEYAQAPIGCGPYKFVRWERNREIIVERWDDYHGKKPHFKRQIFKVVKDPNQALNLFKKGDLDEIEITPLQFATQTNDADFAKVGVKAFHPLWSYSCVGWNGVKASDKSNPFFTDRLVRRAMAHAANIPLVLKNLTYGLSKQASGIFQPGAWMYNEQVQLLSYDLDKARALLDKAGWRINESDGGRYKEIDGERVKFEFTLLIPQGSTIGQAFAAIFMEDLAQIGVTLK